MAVLDAENRFYPGMCCTFFFFFFLLFFFSCSSLPPLPPPFFLATLFVPSPTPLSTETTQLTDLLCYPFVCVSFGQLALALGIAVAIMASWHILQLAWAETSVEGHDNEYYRLKAIERGQGTFENGYDLGWKWNLKVGFLNLGPEGG